MSTRRLTSAFHLVSGSAFGRALSLVTFASVVTTASATTSGCARAPAHYPVTPAWPYPSAASGQYEPAVYGGPQPNAGTDPIGRRPAPLPAQPGARATAPATRYAKLAPSACLSELQRRRVPYRVVESATRGVSQAIRLIGPVRGVHVRPTGPVQHGETSVHDILDCRLALALHDFAAVLAAHSVSEIRHLSMYRPGATIRSSGRPSQHGAALAIDIAQVIFTNGTHLDVEDHWNGGIGSAVCGEGSAPTHHTEAAYALRSIICHAAEQRIFNVILTPNYNRAHFNHFHLDLNAGQQSFTLR